jgi:hypothetical protein
MGIPAISSVPVCSNPERETRNHFPGTDYFRLSWRADSCFCLSGRPAAGNSFPAGGHAGYFKRHQPIGCREMATLLV